MSYLRSQIVQGPAKVTHGSAVFYTKEDFEAKIVRETVMIGNNLFGSDAKETEVMVEASLVPEGRVDASDTTVKDVIVPACWPWLFNHSTLYKGKGLWTDTDKAVRFDAADGEIHTIIAGQVTKMPDLLFSAIQSAVGSMTFTGLRSGSVSPTLEWTTANNLYTVASGGSSIADSTFSNSLILTQAYTGSLTGSAGLATAFDTIGGFKVAFNLQIGKTVTDRLGMVNMPFQGLDIAVTFEPVFADTSSANMFTDLSLSGGVRGRSMLTRANSFSITGADSLTYLTIPKATLKSGSFRFGSKDNYLRQGEYALVSNWRQSSGTQQPLVSVLLGKTIT